MIKGIALQAKTRQTLGLRHFSAKPNVRIETIGESFALRKYLVVNNKRVSPWHNLSFREDPKQDANLYTAFFEISRGTLPKMEVATDEEYNPVKQDTRKNKKKGEKELRFYGKEPPFNYGMIPQTWENSKHIDRDTQCMGDNDPLDVVELGKKTIQTGEYMTVKVLGSICLIDQEELDWKILTMNLDDAKTHKVSTIEDFNRLNPGATKEIFEWFRMIKTYDGKPQNRFGHDEKVLSVEKTLEIIHENHEFYQQLIKGKIPNNSGFWFDKDLK